MENIEIYIATHKDHIEGDDIHIPIQVGAALTYENIQDVKDNTGQNISDKNASYCELTAYYWMWKNSKADIIGLEHYRRRFAINQQQIEKTLMNNDFIIPKVYKFRESLENEYKQFHYIDDWNILKKVMNKLHPELDELTKDVFLNNRLVPYNMFIAKKNVADEYFKWLFPILDTIVEQNMDRQNDRYQERYIGFISERLFTLYLAQKDIKVYECIVKQQQNSWTKIKQWIGQNIINNLYFKMFQ